MKIANTPSVSFIIAANFAVSQFFSHLQSEFSLADKKQTCYSTNQEVGVLVEEFLFCIGVIFKKFRKDIRTQLNQVTEHKN